MKNAVRSIMAVVAAIMMLPTFAETWYWNPTVSETKSKITGYGVSNGSNWTNALGATGVPAQGDSVVFNDSTDNKPTSFNNTHNWWREIWWYNSAPCNQYWLCIDSVSSSVHLRKNVFKDSAGLIVYGEGEFELDSTVDIAFIKGISNRNYSNVAYTSPAGSTFVKTGSWKFTCFSDGGDSRNYTLPRTKLREGTFNLTSGLEHSGKAFMFCGPLSSRFEIGLSSAKKDLVLLNSTISEDEEAIGSDHGFTSSYGSKLVMKGTPGANPMVFTGKFFGSAGLEWNPDSSGSEFVFSNAVSDTTGSLVVDNGIVRFAKGAGMSALGSASVGATGKIAFDGGADAFTCTSLVLETGAKVVIPSGVYRAFAAVSYGGSAVPDGLHSAASAEWIEGGGFAVVGTGTSSAATSATWNGTGDVTTLANWNGAAALPAIDNGSLDVAVAGGSSMNLDSDAYLRGIAFGVNSFTLSADAGRRLAIGAGGLSGTGAGTYSLTAPMAVVSDQVWAFSDGDTVNFNAELASAPGTTLSVTGGTANVNVGSSIGSAGGTAAFEYRSRLTFAGGTTNDANVQIYNGNSVNDGSNDYWFGDDNAAQKVKFEAGGETVLRGGLANERTPMKLELAANAKATLTGGVYSENSLFMYLGAGSRIRIEGKPLLNRNKFDVSGSSADFVIELAARGNCLGFANAWDSRNNKGTIKCLVPYALEDATIAGVFSYKGTLRPASDIGHFELASNAILDMDGNDQSLKVLYAKAGTVTSSGAATMHLNASNGYWDNYLVRADNATWTGGAGLSFSGVNNSQIRYMLKESSTTGILEVVQGTVVMTAPSSAGNTTVDLGNSKTANRTATGGRWPNASAVVIRGGSVVVEHRRAFGRTVRVEFEGASGAYGKLNIASGVALRAAEVYVDGVRLPNGLYSAAGGSSTVQRDDILDGDGVLYVGPVGMSVIVF